MKLIKFYEFEKWKSKIVLRDALANSPTRQITIDEMEKRCRLLRMIDKMNGAADLVLEDADAAAFTQALETYPWGIADEELLQILNAVRKAEKAPQGMVPPEVE